MKLIILAALIGACAAAVLKPHPARRPRYPYNAYNPYNPYTPTIPINYQNVRARAGLDANAAILRSESTANEQGYQYAFDTENGIHADETGYENNGIQAAGSYSYTGDDGQVYSVRYTADANGFQPQGAHIPAIPEAIARSLQQNARDEAAGIFDDGSYRDPKYGAARYPYYRRY